MQAVPESVGSGNGGAVPSRKKQQLFETLVSMRGCLHTEAHHVTLRCLRKMSRRGLSLSRYREDFPRHNEGMRQLGYTRVSTSSQDATLQLDALVAAGVEKRDVFADVTSGTRAAMERPGMRKLLEYAEPGGHRRGVAGGPAGQVLDRCPEHRQPAAGAVAST